MPVGTGLPPPGKRKEIYKYEAPWTVYSMNWSIRPDKRFRLALGSFMEEYNNKVREHLHFRIVLSELFMQFQLTIEFTTHVSYFLWVTIIGLYSTTLSIVQYEVVPS